MKDVTILLPCLNEEKTLEECIKKIKKVMNKTKYNYELLLCDNNSDDKSLMIAKKNKIRYCIENNRGYGNTLRNGINKAFGKYIVMLDCDLSYDEEDIPKFIKYLEEGYDVVIGNRFRGVLEKNAMPLSHFIGAKILSIYSNILFRNNVGDYHCGLRAFKKSEILKLNLKTQGMEFASEMIIKAKLAKLKVKNLPTNYYKDKRDKKSHLKTFKDGFRHLKLINKLKLENSIFFRYSIVFILTLIILLAILFVNCLIPQRKIYNNTLKSFDYYYKNLKIGYLNNNKLEKDYYKIDYAADIKSVSMSYLIDEDYPIKSLIKMNYYPEIDSGFRDYSKMLQDNHKIESYSRYWHGQTIFLRSLLLFTNIQKIYYIFIFLFFLILIILFIKLLRTDKVLFISFFLSTIAINLFIVPFCFEYIFVFLIAMIGTLIILKMLENNSKNFDILFLILGMITCFFDFLTCETVSLTIPLIIYSYLKLKKQKEISIKEVLKYCILWLMGYSLMFGVKWLIDCIYFESGFSKIIYDKAKIRVIDENKNFLLIIVVNFIKIINCIFPLNKLKYSLTLCILVILITLYKFMFNIEEKNKVLPLIVISILPIVRFILLSSHTNQHYYFVYRAIIPTIILFNIFYVNEMLIFLKKVFKCRKKSNIRLLL